MMFILINITTEYIAVHSTQWKLVHIININNSPNSLQYLENCDILEWSNYSKKLDIARKILLCESASSEFVSCEFLSHLDLYKTIVVTRKQHCYLKI